MRHFNVIKVRQAAVLYAMGWRVAAISERIGMDKSTVYRWIRESPPVWQRALSEQVMMPRPTPQGSPHARPTQKSALRDARKAWALEQSRKGHSVKEIAWGLRMSHSPVRIYLREGGVGPGYYVNRWGLGCIPQLAPDAQWMQGTYPYPETDGPPSESREAFCKRMQDNRDRGHRKRKAAKAQRQAAIQRDIDAGITDIRTLSERHQIGIATIRHDGRALGYRVRKLHLVPRP